MVKAHSMKFTSKKLYQKNPKKQKNGTKSH